MLKIGVSCVLLLLLSFGTPKQRFVSYIDHLSSYWGPDTVSEAIGVPGYNTDVEYDVMILAFKLSDRAADAVDVWSNPFGYMERSNCPLGSTVSEVQQFWLDKFHAQNKIVMASAFGATEFPTSGGKDATATCTKIAQFVKDNQFDGLDLDWEDNSAMNNGLGEEWIIECTKAARAVLPKGKYYLSHAPQAPYFIGKPFYKNGGYVTVHEAVGDLIDWYNIQFYNQGDTTYDSYEELFQQSTGTFSGTAVKNIVDVVGEENMDMIVVGKPVKTSDASNTGWVNPTDLGVWAARANAEFGWNAGIMTWQYPSDDQGKFVMDYNQSFQEELERIELEKLIVDDFLDE